MQNAEPDRQQLRATHQVRLVTPQEEGTAAGDLPAGVFGFTSSAGLAAPLFAVRHRTNFEVHHRRNGGVSIIGFVTPSDAQKLASTMEPVSVTLYPDIDGRASHIVAVSYSQIAQHRQYSIRNTAGLELQVAPTHAHL
jgi:hypothetical protein